MNWLKELMESPYRTKGMLEAPVIVNDATSSGKHQRSRQEGKDLKTLVHRAFFFFTWMPAQGFKLCQPMWWSIGGPTHFPSKKCTYGSASYEYLIQLQIWNKNHQSLNYLIAFVKTLNYFSYNKINVLGGKQESKDVNTRSSPNSWASSRADFLYDISGVLGWWPRRCGSILSFLLPALQTSSILPWINLTTGYFL